MGVESKCIMPLPYYEDDQREHLIRTEYRDLESSTWWKELNLDGVVLYSWGAPRYRKIAKAIHDAGIKLHIHLDTSGDFEGPDWEYLSWIKKILRFTKVKLVDFFRARHLRYADVITVSQPAAENISKRLFYKGWMQAKVVVFPTPVANYFQCHSTIQKERRVVCVGRWSDMPEDKVKRPEFLIQTAKEIVMNDERALVDIYGRIGESLRNTYNTFPESLKARIHLKGNVSNNKLPTMYNSAQVAICTSYSEGTHCASAEAICCGCSLVIPPRKSLSILHWYTSHNSGSIAEEDSPASMARSIINELNLWENQQRDPNNIASHWQSYFHVDKVFNKIFN